MATKKEMAITLASALFGKEVDETNWKVQDLMKRPKSVLEDHMRLADRILTENEKSILNLIATSEMNALNGGVPRTIAESATFLWVDELADDSGLTMNQVKGVVGSLVKKNLISIDIDELSYNDKEEHLVQLTQDGINQLWD